MTERKGERQRDREEKIGRRGEDGGRGENELGVRVRRSRSRIYEYYVVMQ